MSENFKISDAVSQWLFDRACGDWMEISVGADKYRLAYDEELPDDTAKDDPYALVLRRERDGALFDLEIEASVTPRKPVAAAPTAEPTGGPS